ncbi:MAG: ATP-binding protein [Pseudomonadota bacterium]
MSPRKNAQPATPRKEAAAWPEKQEQKRPKAVKGAIMEPNPPARDETEKNGLDRGLSEQGQLQTFLAHLLDNLKVGILVLNPQGKVALVNQAAAGMLMPESAGRDRLGGEAGLELLDKWTEPLWDAGRAGRNEYGRGIVVLRGPAGRLLSCSISPFPWPGDDSGEQGIIVQVEDITGQVSIGAQRDRSRAISAMGEMASEVAHQIRNPLGGMELFASILGREVAGDENLSRLVEHVLSGVRQVNHLLTNYLTLANPPRPHKVPICLDPLVEEALAAAERALEQKKIKVDLKSDQKPVWIEADPELILQVFLNMILNAVEALEFGGALEVEIKTAGPTTEIIFRDDGVGIPPSHLDRVFNPFFTTKEKSLGLGLAVSHRIIDAHNGLLQVKSRAGRGTKVTVTLPTCHPAGTGTVKNTRRVEHGFQTDFNSR